MVYVMGENIYVMGENVFTGVMGNKCILMILWVTNLF